MGGSEKTLDTRLYETSIETDIMNYFIQRVRGCCPPWSTLHYTPPRDQQSIDGAEQLQVKDLFKVLVEQQFPTFQTRGPLHQRFQTCGPPLFPEKFFSFHSNFFLIFSFFGLFPSFQREFLLFPLFRLPSQSFLPIYM